MNEKQLVTLVAQLLHSGVEPVEIVKRLGEYGLDELRATELVSRVADRILPDEEKPETSNQGEEIPTGKVGMSIQSVIDESVNSFKKGGAVKRDGKKRCKCGCALQINRVGGRLVEKCACGCK